MCGLAFCDVSTGAFHVTQTSGEDWAESACNELGSFLPAEALLGGEATESEPVNAVLRQRLGACVNRGTDAQFDLARCAAALDAQFGAQESLEPMPCAIRAAGALLETLKNLQKNDLPHIRQLDLYMAGRFMGLDLAARRNLELTQTHALKGKAREPALGARPDADGHGRAVCCAAGWSVPCSPPRRSRSGFLPWKS